MKITRLFKIFTVPIKLLRAQLYPAKYGQTLGVTMNGSVIIYNFRLRAWHREKYHDSLIEYENIFLNVEKEIKNRLGKKIQILFDLVDKIENEKSGKFLMMKNSLSSSECL